MSRFLESLDGFLGAAAEAADRVLAGAAGAAESAPEAGLGAADRLLAGETEAAAAELCRLLEDGRGPLGAALAEAARPAAEAGRHAYDAYMGVNADLKALGGALGAELAGPDGRAVGEVAGLWGSLVLKNAVTGGVVALLDVTQDVEAVEALETLETAEPLPGPAPGAEG